MKESAGYPDTQGLLFTSGNDTMPIVNLVPGGFFDDVDIRLAPPDGTLKGTVVDAETGRPLWQARITLRRTDRPEAIYSTSLPPDAHFLFALPAAPIEITVIAPQHVPWKYQDPATGATSLVLQAASIRP